MKLATLTALVASLLASAPVFAAGYHYDAGGSTRTWHQGIGMRPIEPAWDPDPSFLVRAHQDAVTQIQLAQLALRRAADPEVRDYAERLLQDDSQLDRLVSDRAARIGVALPASADLCDDLARLRGADFEVAFLERSMQTSDAIRAEFASYKEAVRGDVHEAFADAFDELVQEREIAKPLHDRIRNESRHHRRDRDDDDDRDGDRYRS